MICPQCRQDKPGFYFEPPIKTCLVCYGSLPWNRGLSQQELRTAARTSRYARKQRRREGEHARWAPQITPDGSARADTVQSRVHHNGDQEQLYHCDGCKSKKPLELLEELLESPGDTKPLLCSTCHAERMTLRHHCSLCQQEQPLSSLEPDGLHQFFYCPTCITKRKEAGL